MIIKTRAKIIASIGTFTALLLSIIICTMPTSAAANADITEKSLLYGVARCYYTGAMNSSINANEYSSYTGLIANNQQYVKMPTGYASSNMIKCSKAFDEAFSAVSYTPPTRNSGTNAIGTFLEGMGYTTKTSGSAGKCTTYTYTVVLTTTTMFNSNESTNTSWAKLCASTVNGDGTIGVDKMEVSYGGSYGDGSGSMSDIVSMDAGNKYVQVDCANFALGNGGCGKWEFTPGTTKWEDFAETIYADLYSNNRSGTKIVSADMYSSSSYTYSLNESHPTEDYGDATAAYSFSDANAAADAAIAFLSDYSRASDLALSETERIIMLQGFLDDFWVVDNYGCGLTSAQISGATQQGYKAISMYINGRAQTCYVKPTKNANNSVNGYNASTFYPDGSSMSWDDATTALSTALGDLEEASKQICIDTAETERTYANSILRDNWSIGSEIREQAQATIAELDQILSDHGQYWYKDDATGNIACYPFTGVNGQTVTPVMPSPDDDGDDDPDDGGDGAAQGDDMADCFNNTGALGWVYCPAMKLIGQAASGIYAGIANEWLQVGADEVQKGDGIYVGWSAFRDFANVVFVIIFLLVIISQITGFGISNYGIKKILPSLIIVAVLVNISFFLCQIAVDVTNVIGDGVMDFFTNLPTGGTADSGSAIFQTVLGNLLGAVGILGVVAGAVAVVALNPTLILPVLLGVLSAVISVLFIYILLALRKAGVVITIILAPLAIVCYALPNTKSLFDKWRKTFTALLMVYPICQIVMGASQYVSSLMLNSDNTSFIYNFVALLLQIVPLFLIPTFIRTSLMAFGNIGMRVSQLGNRLSGAATRGIRNSEAYKTKQEQLEGLGAKGRLRRDEDGWANKHKILGLSRRIGAKMRSGNNGISRALNDSYNRRHLRDMETLKRVNKGSLRAENSLNEEPFNEGTLAYNATRDQLADEVIEERAKAYSVAHEHNGDTDDKVRGDLEQALRDMTDADVAGDKVKYNDAKARMWSAHDFLAKTDTGRTLAGKVMQNFGQDEQYDEALKESSKYLARKHDSEYKAGNRGTRAMYMDFMREDVGFSKVRGEDGQYSGAYDIAKLGDYSPNTFSEADDIVHDNVEEYSKRLKNQFGGTGEGVKAGIAALRTSVSGRKASYENGQMSVEERQQYEKDLDTVAIYDQINRLTAGALSSTHPPKDVVGDKFRRARANLGLAEPELRVDHQQGGGGDASGGQAAAPRIITENVEEEFRRLTGNGNNGGRSRR